MLSTLGKTLRHILTANHTKKCTKVTLFSGSAYFSNRVPKGLREKWVAHGGEISSGATLDVRARYFFAMDPSDPWATKLFANSVIVIHAGWIIHCIEESFAVPISEYILDDRFIPGPPYKLTTNSFGTYTALSERENYICTEHEEYGLNLIQTSDTPSTPTSIPRKRRREQAYFDSPSRSFVFSTFDKDGLPRRPRKLRKLRFDPSFSPKGGSPDSETIQIPVLEAFEDHEDHQSDEEHSQYANVCLLPTSPMATVRMPDTPDKPLTTKDPTVPRRHSPSCERLQDPIHLSPPGTTVGIQEKRPTASIRTIDFTNLPLPTRRRFRGGAKTARDTTTLMSITRLTENEVKTPKKLSFADHAQVHVYPVSPQQPDSTVLGPAQQLPEVNDETRVLGKSCARTTVITKDLALQRCSLGMDNENRVGENRFENDTLTLTMKDVEAIRCRLLESATANGIDDGQLSTTFELGKTFRGMAFRHVW